MAKQTIFLGTTANDGTGTPLRDSLDICNDNFDELYSAAKFGVWNYNNNLGSQAITATTWAKVNNDGAGAFTYLGGALSGVDIYNTTTSQFDYSDLVLYDSVDIRFDANMTTTAANQEVLVRLLLSVGSLNIPLTFISTQFKTAGAHALVGLIQNQIFTENVRTNPSQIEIYSDASLTLNLNGWSVKASKRI